jgi:hypothetical protein
VRVGDVGKGSVRHRITNSIGPIGFVFCDVLTSGTIRKVIAIVVVQIRVRRTFFAHVITGVIKSGSVLALFTITGLIGARFAILVFNITTKASTRFGQVTIRIEETKSSCQNGIAYLWTLSVFNPQMMAYFPRRSITNEHRTGIVYKNTVDE